MASKPPGGRLAEERILVLDDEPAVLEVLTQHLGSLGYECSATLSPVEGIERIGRQSFDLILTDLRMPELDGMEVVRRAKKIAPDVPVVVVTALNDITNAIQAMRLGADDYVLKPFDLQEITRAASRAIDQRRIKLEQRGYQDDLEERVSSAAKTLEDVNRELRDTKEYLENLLHSTLDAILTVTGDAGIGFANTGALDMLGYTQQEIEGLSTGKLLAGGDEEVAHVRRLVNTEKRVRNYETELVHRDGTRIPVNVSLSVVRGNGAGGISILAVCKDITEQKRLERELKEMSIKDSLTGLYNQRHFYDRIEHEIERARRQRHPLSLLLFDVDGLKQYNDLHGHLEETAPCRPWGPPSRSPPVTTWTLGSATAAMNSP